MVAVGVAAAALGVFGLLARATHAGGVKRSSAKPTPLAAPQSFVQALNTGLAPGAVGPSGSPAQAVSGGS